MRHIFGNLRPYWKLVVLIFCFLMIQAYCDLALPQYTQNIIDTGIQNKGIDHVLPERISAGEYEDLAAMMEDDEKKELAGAYEFKSDYYERKSLDEEELDRLDDKLIMPVVLRYMSTIPDYRDMMQGVEVNEKTLPLIREKMEKAADSVGDKTLHSMGTAYAAACLTELGIDLEDIQKGYLWAEGRRMVLTALLMLLASSAVSFIAARVGAGVGRDLRKRMYTNVMSFSNSEMDKFSSASLITRSTNDVQQVQQTTIMMLRMVLFAPVLGTWGVIKVAGTGAGMGWVIGLALLVIIGVVVLLIAVTLPKFKIMQKLVDGLNLVAREILTGLPVIRAFGREETEEKRFDAANIKLRDTQLFTGRVMSLMMPVMMFIMAGLGVLITWVSAGRIDDGVLEVGAMTAFITYSMLIVMSFMMMTVMSIMLPRAGVAADRIHEVMTEETSIKEPENPVIPDNKTGLIEFNDVSFRYPSAEEDVLTGITFTAKPGETTAIIGSTGSGKTTLVNLIPRFYDITGGSLKVDGVEVSRRSIADLRREIGFVPQKGTLFSGTVASNIRYGDGEITDEEVKASAGIAQANEFIEANEEGYEREISQGGSNVSGGQKQRLQVARAIAISPKIAIFDDSFSALDMKTDARLRKALDEKTEGITRIVVAQRVSTILHAEQILVLDRGRIAGKGTHEELLEGCEVYREIALSQLSEEELGGIA